MALGRRRWSLLALLLPVGAGLLLVGAGVVLVVLLLVARILGRWVVMLGRVRVDGLAVERGPVVPDDQVDDEGEDAAQQHEDKPQDRLHAPLLGVPVDPDADPYPYDQQNDHD